MQFQTQVAAGRGKQNNCPPTQFHLRLCWSWPRFSVYTDAAHLQPGLLLLAQFPGSPGLEAPRTNTTFPDKLLLPCPKARPSSALSPSLEPPEDHPSSHLPSTGSGVLGSRGHRSSWFESVSQRRIYRAQFGDSLELVISEVSLGW